MLNDLRFALRMLLKNPGFTFVVVPMLAMGIGLNTAIFTLFDVFMFRPPQIKDPQRVVAIYSKYAAGLSATLPYAEYTGYRYRGDIFTGLAAWTATFVSVGDVPRPAPSAESDAPTESQIWAGLVSGNYFQVLGVRVVLGRTFLPEEDQAAGSGPVVILSNSFWQRRCGSDPQVVGRTLRISGHPFTVIGIAERGFTGSRSEIPLDAWIPLSMHGQMIPGTTPNNASVQLIGRLNTGVIPAQAQASLDVVYPQVAMSRAKPDPDVLGVVVKPILQRGGSSGLMPIGLLLLTVTGMILIIVSANVANMSMARAASRYKEIGIRLSLGASRSRIVRQLLIESSLIALLGGVLGVFLSFAASHAFFVAIQRVLMQSLSIDLTLIDTSPNLRILLFTTVVSAVTGLLIGLVSAIQTNNLDLTSALKNDGTLFGHRISNSRLRNLLVIPQLSVCLMLLIGAGLLVRGLNKAQATDPGFVTKNLLVVTADLRSNGYDPVRRAEFYRSFAERLSRFPGTRSIGFASWVPLGLRTQTNAIRAEGETAAIAADYTVVSPDFFSVLGIPVLHGRVFVEEETREGSPVAIINEVLARKLWPGQDPIGKRFAGVDIGTEVIGVVGNTRSSQLWEPDKPYFYLPLRPLVRGNEANRGNLEILIRTEGDPRLAATEIRGAMQALGPNLWPKIRTMEENLGLWLMPSRVGAWLAGGLGLLALLVTSIGLYGVIAYATAQRTREFGIRMALGASPAGVLRLVLRQGWRLIFAGVLLGVAGAVALGQVLSRFLYGLSPLDPVAFGSVSAFLSAIALLACYLPAHRASKVDPLVALRSE